jgi:hypothetical protein
MKRLFILLALLGVSASAGAQNYWEKVPWGFATPDCASGLYWNTTLGEFTTPTNSNTQEFWAQSGNKGVPCNAGIINPMGINDGAGGAGTHYYEGFPMFKNRVRESQGFSVYGTPGSPATLNSAGWPTQSFGVLLWIAAAGTPPSWLSGTWSCGFIGTGSETVSTYQAAQNTVTNYVARSGGAYSTFNLVIGTPTNAAVDFQVGNVSTAVTNIYCYLPEYNTLSGIDTPTSSSAYTTEALAHYSNYNFIRWMNWNEVIGNATTMTSANRLTPSNTQAPWAGSSLERVPQEWVAGFSVAANAGAWLNLPPVYDGTYTYVTSLANALFAQVPAGHKIYLEEADEMWNDAGAGITAWQNSATSFGSTWGYLATQVHAMAGIFKSVYGARYGTDVCFVEAWQSGSNGVFFQWNIWHYYQTQGWTINAANGGDFCYTSIAPYMNTGYTSGQYNNTVAQILATLTTAGTSQAFNSAMEQNVVMGMKYGLAEYTYEGGWQTNAENSELVNAGAAILNSGMTAVMNNYYQGEANSGVISFGTYTGGVDSNDTGNLSPVDEFTTQYPITNSTPRFASILNYTAGWTPTRNVVTNAGATIPGGNYLDTSGGTLPTLAESGYDVPFDAPNYGECCQVSYLVWTAAARNAALVVNFTNTGGAGSTHLEYGSSPNGYTILGGGTPTSVAIPSGTNNVSVATVPLAKGWNYITLGVPNTTQSAITVNSLTLN